MTARRHHYIPQCYLKGFAEVRDRPQLFVVDAKERRSFYTWIGNIAVELDFHRIDAPGQPLDVLEKKIAESEGELAPALERVIAARSISDQDNRSQLFMLMGLLCLKNPRRRKSVNQVAEKLAKVFLGTKVATPERWHAEMERAKAEGHIDKDADAEAIRKLILNDGFRFALTTPAHLQMEFGGLERILPYIFGRKWVLCKVDSGAVGFVTSDCPVCVMWQDPKEQAPAGLGLMGTQIVFPISNDLAMIGTFELDGGEMDADEDFVSKVNGNIILHSNRQVYARSGDFLYQLQHNATVMHGMDLLSDAVL